jgi:F-type H+-transporting ATPase subunit b
MLCRNFIAGRSQWNLSKMLRLVMVFGLTSSAALASGGDNDSESEVVKQTLYQLGNLLLLLGLLFYVGRKPVTEFFASRRASIQSELQQAAEILAEAEHRNADLQRRLVDLSSEVEEIKANASRRAAEDAERILADARSTAERIRRDASAAVDHELRRARTQLREEAADLAVEIAARKLNQQVVDSDRERLMDEFITRIEPSSGRAGGSSRADGFSGADGSSRADGSSGEGADR